MQVYIARASEKERAGSTIGFLSLLGKGESWQYAADRHARGYAPTFELQNTMELLLMHQKDAKVRGVSYKNPL